MQADIDKQQLQMYVSGKSWEISILEKEKLNQNQHFVSLTNSESQHVDC